MLLASVECRASRDAATYRERLPSRLVLIQSLVYGGNLPLAECIVESLVDRVGAHAQACSGIAVDRDGCLKAPILQIQVHVRESRVPPEAGGEERGPVVERGDVLRLQSVLILGVTGAPAYLNVLCGLQEQTGL